MAKEVHVVRDVDGHCRELVFEIRPVFEYKMTKVIQGLQSKEVSSAPFYFSSEEAIFEYLEAFGDNYFIKETDAGSL